MLVKLCHAMQWLSLNPKLSCKLRAMLVMCYYYNGPTMALLSLSQIYKEMNKEFTIIPTTFTCDQYTHQVVMDAISNVNNSKTNDGHHFFWDSTL